MAIIGFTKGFCVFGNTSKFLNLGFRKVNAKEKSKIMPVFNSKS